MDVVVLPGRRPSPVAGRDRPEQLDGRNVRAADRQLAGVRAREQQQLVGEQRERSVSSAAERSAATSAGADFGLGESEFDLGFHQRKRVPVSERTLLCRVGSLEVDYPRGAVWLAETARSAVQGAMIRPAGDGHNIFWGAPRPGPVDHATVTEAVQELFDVSVARDPAPWLGWITDT